ncbi:MAG TPA: polysaccharide deacetylase family protein [Candidatus Acidoferrales bacterium]|nr:polysaccharide deacetylase family protein [Candidatus Acidoferrales bacterium]
MFGVIAGLVGAGAATAAVVAGAHTMVPWSQMYGANFNGLKDGTRALALTYDDGPNDPWTMRLLEMLAKHEVRATFFMVGRYVEKHPEIAREVFAAGHAVGNHAYSHRNLIFANEQQLRDEIEKTQRAIETATGETPFLFRPPFGGRRPATFRVARSYKLEPIMWRVTCYDWSARSAEEIVKTADRQIAGGEVVLLHDGGHEKFGVDRRYTVEATDKLISMYKDRDFQFITIPEMLQARPGVNLPFV